MKYKDSNDYSGEMISRSSSAPAGLPQEIMNKKYPDCKYMSDENLGDSLSGIDKVKNADHAKMMKNRSKTKY